MKITQSAIEKQLTSSDANTFEMEDISAIVERTEVAPMLLTALLGGEADTINLETNTIKYDELEETLQLPSGKRFDEYGPRLQNDKPRQLIYEVGSFGLTSNIAPKDYANRRKAGSNELMDEAYLANKMNAKAEKAWALFDELSFAQLITTDTNITLGSPAPAYNYHNDILGTARAAKISMQLGAAVDHFGLFGDQVELLTEDLEKTGNSQTMTICLCGKTFFAQRKEIELQTGHHRELRGPLDLASMSVPTSNFGSGSGRFQYQYFDSHDGIRYILYSASILGTKMIGDNDAYMMPVGAETFIKRVYAPAQTRTYVNTVAQARYAWSKEDERKGITQAQESNVLPVLVNPQLVRHLTV